MKKQIQHSPIFKSFLFFLLLLILVVNAFSQKKSTKNNGKNNADYILATDTSAKKMLAEIETFKNDSLKNIFSQYIGKEFDKIDSTEIEKLKKYTKNYSEYFKNILINNSDIFRFNGSEIKAIKELNIKANYSEGKFTDAMIANIKNKEINIFIDNRSQLLNFLTISLFPHKSNEEFLQNLYLFNSKFFGVYHNIDAIDILFLLDSSKVKELSQDVYFQNRFRKIPDIFLFLHEFAHIYLNTKNEELADDFAFNKLKNYIDSFQSNIVKFELTKGIDDMFLYSYSNMKFDEYSTEFLNSQKENALQRRRKYAAFLLTSFDSTTDKNDNKMTFYLLKEKLKEIVGLPISLKVLPFEKNYTLHKALLYLRYGQFSKNNRLDYFEKGLSLIEDEVLKNKEQLSESERELLLISFALLYKFQYSNNVKTLYYLNEAKKINSNLIQRDFYKTFEYLIEQEKN